VVLKMVCGHRFRDGLELGGRSQAPGEISRFPAPTSRRVPPCSLFRGLKPPASVHRPFGPETTFGIRSNLRRTAPGEERRAFASGKGLKRGLGTPRLPVQKKKAPAVTSRRLKKKSLSDALSSWLRSSRWRPSSRRCQQRGASRSCSRVPGPPWPPRHTRRRSGRRNRPPRGRPCLSAGGWRGPS